MLRQLARGSVIIVPRSLTCIDEAREAPPSPWHSGGVLVCRPATSLIGRPLFIHTFKAGEIDFFFVSKVLLQFQKINVPF
jgi:hypothetical protein